MSKRGDLYSRLFSSFRKCYPLIKPLEAQRQVNEEWRTAKSQYKTPDFEIFVEGRIRKYLEDATKRKTQNILRFFKTKTADSTTHKSASNEDALVLSTNSKSLLEATSYNTLKETSSTAIEIESTTSSGNNNNSTNTNCLVTTTMQLKTYATPSQVLSKEKIAILNSELHSKELRRDAGLAEIGIQKDINNLREEISREQKLLRKKENNANRQKKFRSSQKLKLKKAVEIPGVDEVLKLQKTPGRPKIETNQPELFKTILDIATFSGGADPKRRTEVVHCVRTLNELHDRLLELGFTLSRSATYLRLLPRNSTTIEGKRHSNTVPVKLSRARADSHKKHPDGQFATSTIRSLEEIASLLGPGQVGWISQDDKNKVPLGLPAANKQTPLLMHIEYRVTLPDHDWVVASRHKLTPSVYAGIKIEPQGLGRPEAVGYSGPTYIAVRSGKHSSSTAATHSEDFETLINLEIFKDFLKTPDNQVKPVLIFSVDGGPDENPRYQKTISFAVQHFKNHNLDALFLVTNAPGRSAYNRVERRMAPLSKQLSGLILEHDHFGSHLDNNGKTIDDDLELRNFEHAGQLLAQIWSEMVIDGYPVFSEYKNNKGTVQFPEKVDPQWYTTHIRESQYFLQICKCNNLQCCGKARSNIGFLLKGQFLPPPYPLYQTEKGTLAIPPPKSEQSIKFAPLLVRLAVTMTPKHDYQEIPYDLYCPSVFGDIKERICDQCDIYFATKSSLATHYKIHGRKRRTIKIKPKRIVAHREDEMLCVIDSKTEFDDLQWLPINDVDNVDTLDVSRVIETVKSVEIIENVPEWLAGPWAEDVSI